MDEPRILKAGDRALVIEYGDKIDEEINNRVQEMSNYIETASDMGKINGIIEVLPTYRSLMVYYEPSLISYSQLCEWIMSVKDSLSMSSDTKKTVLEIPCCYGARFGPDLGDMEKQLGIDRDEIIKLHSSVEYKIYMLGFLPGFVYLGGLDKRIHMPRLSSPRLKINPGAVGIGGSQTGVYPMASPGGWRLIGGTPVDFYNPLREEPVLCKAGEYLRFIPINIDEYYDIRNVVVKGDYKIRKVVH